MTSVRVGIPNTDGLGILYVTFTKQEKVWPQAGLLRTYINKEFWDDERDHAWLEGVCSAVGRLAQFDHNVRLDYDHSFWGHSEGMMFAVGLYSVLTGMHIGKVTGSATIDGYGNLGPVSGLHEKLAAAEAGGFDYFIVHSSQAHITGRKTRVIGADKLTEVLSIATGQPLWRATR